MKKGNLKWEVLADKLSAALGRRFGVNASGDDMGSDLLQEYQIVLAILKKVSHSMLFHSFKRQK